MQKLRLRRKMNFNKSMIDSEKNKTKQKLRLIVFTTVSKLSPRLHRGERGGIFKGYVTQHGNQLRCHLL
jgi:hypothetical protein